jgi:hypothetical protein
MAGAEQWQGRQRRIEDEQGCCDVQPAVDVTLSLSALLDAEMRAIADMPF